MIDLSRFIDLFKPKKKQGFGLKNSPENNPPDAPGFIVERIKAINWSQYDTAYGNAEQRVPVYLKELFCSDKKLAMQATHDLWCSLCHQHAYISTASLPAYES